VWEVHRAGRGLLYTFRAPRTGIYKALAIDRAITRGTLYFPRRRGGPRYALDFPLDELLFQHHLARVGALEVHACAVVEGGQALLFCGQSGAGKSTTARLWRRYRPEAHTLSDDRVVLRAQGGALVAHGTPWHGDGGFASPGHAPLRAVFFLRQARRPALLALHPAEATARLFTRTFPPMWDASAVRATLRTCARAAAQVPVFELRFPPDASAVATVLKSLGRP
jgi:hypothetical protein